MVSSIGPGQNKDGQPQIVSRMLPRPGMGVNGNFGPFFSPPSLLFAQKFGNYCMPLIGNFVGFMP
jgi:hypothetical protein